MLQLIHPTEKVKRAEKHYIQRGVKKVKNYKHLCLKALVRANFSIVGCAL